MVHSTPEWWNRLENKGRRNTIQMAAVSIKSSLWIFTGLPLIPQNHPINQFAGGTNYNGFFVGGAFTPTAARCLEYPIDPLPPVPLIKVPSMSRIKFN